MFAIFTALRPPKSHLQSWDWNLNGENADYVGLYPRAWTVFRIPEQNLKLTCRQVSPVIPNNYKVTLNIFNKYLSI